MAKKSKILIAGDSFSTIWPGTKGGWMELLANDFDVTNLSQAGIGEYKILQQLKSIDTSLFEFAIVSHTSPSRIHTKNHPIHKEGLHSNCDLIYTDLEDRFDWFNENLRISKKFFEYHYDEDYQLDIYNLIRKEIKNIVKSKYISISHIKIATTLSTEDNHIDFSDLWLNHRGTINHYDSEGNIKIYKTLKEQIDGRN